MNIKRIIFTGDILRPFFENGQWTSATNRNILWIKHLINWQLSKATSLPQSYVSWETNRFNGADIYNALNLPLNYDTWASILYLDSLPAHVDELLITPFKDAFVIGCEIPDILQMALTRHHIPFIDIIAHPVRFMEDLLFAFRTNHPGVHNKLINYQINLNDYCIPRANLLRAKAMWMKKMPIPPGTALITGQVATDKALICRRSGKFLNLSHYVDEISNICNNHPLVLFKPHPYQDANCPSRKVIASFSNIQEVKHNFYYLITQHELSDVYAINSGTVSEAPYFDKSGHLFGEPLYQFGTTPPTETKTGYAIPIGLDFLEPAFWVSVLEPATTVNQHIPPHIPLARPSLLRRSLNADWDYSFIDAIVQHNV